GTCWSFHGNAGTFGIVLDAANVIPSHVVIHHQLFNSTASLCNAPCQITIWGLIDGVQNLKAYTSSQHALAATGQPFPVSKEGIFFPLANIMFDITA
ncbi:hypothetical protein F5148DRAFT_990404, partial [Russula earlei]